MLWVAGSGAATEGPEGGGGGLGGEDGCGQSEGRRLRGKDSAEGGCPRWQCHVSIVAQP